MRSKVYEAMTCPNCRAVMATLTLDSHYGRPLVIDLCEKCQAFWFDGLESLQLEPASVLQLFRIVAKAGGSARPSLSGGARAPILHDAQCPRCGHRLVLTYDQQRQSRFEYRRCPDGHGRLTSFHSFLREKDFIKPMSPAEIEDLRRNLRSVNCSNCGAPVDLAKGTACAHCGSPLSVIDVGRANAALAALAQWLEF